MCKFIMLDSDIRSPDDKAYPYAPHQRYTDTMEFMSNDSDICNVPDVNATCSALCLYVKGSKLKDYSSLCGNNPVISAALTVNGDDITGRHILGR
jgi:hypothetical protein